MVELCPKTESLRTRGASDVSSSPSSGEDQSSSFRSQARRLNSSFLHILFYSGPQRIGNRMTPIHSGKANCFTQSTESMLISSGNALLDTARINVYPSTWTLCSLVKLTFTINHHYLFILNE